MRRAIRISRRWNRVRVVLAAMLALATLAVGIAAALPPRA